MISTVVVLATLSFPGAAMQDAQEILERVAATRAERMAFVTDYTIIQRVQGTMEAPFYYEKFAPLGGTATLYRLVPIAEWQERNAPPGFNGPALAAGMRDALGMMAGPLGAQMTGTPAGRFMPPGAMDQVMDGANKFLDAAANPPPNTSGEDAMNAAAGAAMFAERGRYIGMEMVNGQNAFLLRADDLGDLPVQQVGDATFTMKRISVWIDDDQYVQLRLRVEGVMTSGNKTVPIVIEQDQLDYASVGRLYEPLSSVSRITGLMAGMDLDPKQRAKMEKAKADMEKIKRKIAMMPPSQRAMFEGQIAPAMAQLERMTGSDVIEAKVEYMVYSIDKGPPFKWKPFDSSLEPDAQPFVSSP